MFFLFVIKHACDSRTDRRTDRITITKTPLAQLSRAVKTGPFHHIFALSFSVIFTAQFNYCATQLCYRGLSDRNSAVPTYVDRFL